MTLFADPRIVAPAAVEPTARPVLSAVVAPAAPAPAAPAAAPAARPSHPAAARPVHPARPTTVTPVPARPRPAQQAPSAPLAPAVQPTSPAPRPRAVPEGTEARGFALYVGFDGAKAAAAGTELGRIVEELKRVLARVAPGAESYASVALAPAGAGGRDVDVVRLALQDPAAIAKHRHTAQSEEQDPDGTGVVVDISRKRLVLDGDNVGLTYKEFELLQYLVLREGRTIERAELISSLWSGIDEEGAPNERTIDVHVRRLRAKLGRYEDIVRTVRGVGYRFDRHADVAIKHAGAPSPDLF